jgi:hypothetical protein
MSILLPALGVAFAAFCVWLRVRIVNRREPWAKRTLAVMLGVPLLYILSLGPACWLADLDILPKRQIKSMFTPAVAIVNQFPMPIQRIVMDYVSLAEPRRSRPTSLYLGAGEFTVSTAGGWHLWIRSEQLKMLKRRARAEVERR